MLKESLDLYEVLNDKQALNCVALPVTTIIAGILLPARITAYFSHRHILSNAEKLCPWITLKLALKGGLGRHPSDNH